MDGSTKSLLVQQHLPDVQIAIIERAETLPQHVTCSDISGQYLNDKDKHILQIQVNTFLINNLQEFGEKFPNLNTLKLDNSIIHSIRDLGTYFGRIVVLSMRNCKLSDISGLSSLPLLKELYIPFNEVHDISPVSTCTELEVLDLECNKIAEPWQLEFLSLCPKLKILVLAGNHLPEIDYIQAITKVLPGLAVLDHDLLDNPVPNSNGRLQYDNIRDVTAEARKAQTGQIFCGNAALAVYSKRTIEG